MAHTKVWHCKWHGMAWRGLPQNGMACYSLHCHVSCSMKCSNLVVTRNLQVGDVLYMPRGCIHQAAAQESDSAHLTISTYQRWSFADLLQVH